MKPNSLIAALTASCLLTSALAQSTDEAPKCPLLDGEIRVGPFYPQYANGITWVVRDQQAYQLVFGFVEKGQLLAEYGKLVLEWRPLAAANDSSYYAMEWKLSGATVKLRWAAQADGQVAGILETDKDVQVALLALPTWKDFPALTYRATPDGLSSVNVPGKPGWSARTASPGLRQLATADVAALTAALVKPGETPASEGLCAGVLYEIKAMAPLKFVAGFDAAAKLSDVDARLAAAQQRYEAGRASTMEAQGLEAIQVMMNTVRVYSPYLKLVAHAVGRGWCDSGMVRVFCWDTFFQGVLGATCDPATTRNTVRVMLASATPEGMVPNFSDDRRHSYSPDRSQPPTGAMGVWKMHQRAPDKAFLEEVYPKLVKWHDWWFSPNPATGKPTRDGNENGLLEWGSATGVFQNMKWETVDDSPMWDDMVPNQATKTMNLDAVDLNALWTMDADYLAKIAEVLGKPQDVARFKGEVETMNRRMNELLWDEEAGLYTCRYWEPRMETFRTTPVPVPQEVLQTVDGAPGLKAEYFSDREFKTAGQTRLESNIVCAWASMPHVKTGEQQKGVSIRWTGKLTVPETATYVLGSLNPHNHGGHLRVWLDGKPSLDDLKIHPIVPTQKTVPLEWTAGQVIDLKVEYSDELRTDGKLEFVWWKLDQATPKRFLSGRHTPAAFFPMISGAPDAQRAARMLANLKDETQFWGEYVIPTVSRKDPAFPGQQYWRGNIWPLYNYLTWLGLQRYGDAALLDAYAAKGHHMFMRSWNANRYAHENYLATDGSGHCDPHLPWATLLTMIQIERSETRSTAGATSPLPMPN